MIDEDKKGRDQVNKGVEESKSEKGAYKVCMRLAKEEGSDFFDNVNYGRFKDITSGIRDKKDTFKHYLNFERAFKETTWRVCPNDFAEKWNMVKNIGLKDIDMMYRVQTHIHDILRLLPYISALRCKKKNRGRIKMLSFYLKINHVNRKALLLFGNLRADNVEKEGIWYRVNYWDRDD